MSALGRLPPAPVGRQVPPARAAAFDSCRSLRDARGPLLSTTGTASTTLYPLQIHRR
jgi:hypothetical protein